MKSIVWGDGAQIEGTPFRIAVDASETDGHAVLLAVDMPPGLHVDAHVHDTEDQINVVVSGRMRCRIGTEEHTVESGGVLLMPRGVEHELWNDTDEFVRVIEM